MLTLAVALVTAIAVTLVQAPDSRADETGGVTWNAGDVTWSMLDDGRCTTLQRVTVGTTSNDEAKTLATVLQGLPAKTNYPAASGIQDTHVVVSDPGDGTDLVMVAHGIVAGDMCQAADGAQQTLFNTTGGGELDTIRLAAAPTWLKGAIGALVGAAVFVGVSTLVTAGVTASGILVGASTATVAAVTGLSGCIGGASSTAMTLLLAGAGDGWQQTVSNAVAGCLSGGTIALLPIQQVGTAVGNALIAGLGSGATATVGAAGVAAATTAGIELEKVAQVITVTGEASCAIS
jgi:hypothetical protein